MLFFFGERIISMKIEWICQSRESWRRHIKLRKNTILTLDMYARHFSHRRQIIVGRLNFGSIVVCYPFVISILMGWKIKPYRVVLWCARKFSTITNFHTFFLMRWWWWGALKKCQQWTLIEHTRAISLFFANMREIFQSTEPHTHQKNIIHFTSKTSRMKFSLIFVSQPSRVCKNYFFSSLPLDTRRRPELARATQERGILYYSLSNWSNDDVKIPETD